MNHADLPDSRRRFFREAMQRAVKPLAEYLERRSPELRQRHLLRPPGAIDESRFENVCLRCGECVEVCPANAIIPAGENDGVSPGTPIINAEIAACVVCDGLKCTHVCPSGALLPLEHPQQIQMGSAQVYESLCVRSRGEPCTICVDRCPIGITALRFDDQGPPTVLADGCVGCGVCQLYCPTQPKAIVVLPRNSS